MELAHLLQMLLPPALGLVCLGVESRPGQLVIRLQTTVSQASCPLCQWSSIRVHSHYRRTLQDLPLWGWRCRLELIVRRFFCCNPHCLRRIFCEPLTDLAGRYARKTQRLLQILQQLTLALAGQGAGRLAQHLAMPSSPTTLLRLLARLSVPPAAAARVVGVDDWAWRKGVEYGTILIDLERQAVVDLLPDRSSESLAQWLLEHPQVLRVSRDRSGIYAQGVALAQERSGRRIAQSADRFHLLLNLRQNLQRMMDRYEDLRREMDRVLAEAETAMPPPAAAETGRGVERRRRRLQRYQQVMALHRQGMGLRQIAREMRLGRNTVRRYVRAGQFPEYSRGWGVMSANAAAWLLMKRPEDLEGGERAALELLLQRSAELKGAWELTRWFQRIVREGRVPELPMWLEAAQAEAVPRELRAFAEGLKGDWAAVEAGVELNWNNGQAEGQVNRLKVLKRQMYGRAGLALLRRRMLVA